MTPRYIVASILAAGLAAAPAAQQTPVFRSGVDVVSLDVSVLDRNRRPVRGLTAADFTVLEDGREQPIVAFSAVDVINPDAPLVLPTRWLHEVPPDVVDNDMSVSRLVVLVLDDALIPQDPRFMNDAKRAAQMIVKMLEPADLMAIVFTGNNRNAQDFTRDRTRLLATVDKLAPGIAGHHFGYDLPSPSGGAGVNTDALYYTYAVRTLSSAAEYLANAPNTRKMLFWISPGVPLDIGEAAPRLAGSIETNSLSNRDIAIDIVRETQEIYRRAQLANVTIYPIDPTGLGGYENFLRTRTKLPDSLAPQKANSALDFVQAVASSTGGRAVINRSDFDHQVANLFGENKAYYLIGFRSGAARAKPGFRRIEVRVVDRPDLTVRTRSGYEVADPRRQRESTLSPEALALGKAIGGLLPNPEMPLQVTVAPFAVPGGTRSTVAIAMEVRQPITAASNERVTEITELQTSAFTPEGEGRGTQRHQARVLLRPGATGEAEYEVLGRIDLSPGRYRLRLAAHNQRSAKTGSVFADVDVPDFNRLAFSASGVVLSASPARPSAPRDAVSGILPVVPTATRQFHAPTRVTAFLRLYQSGRRPYTSAELSIQILDRFGGTVSAETRTIPVERFAATPAQAVQPSILLPQRGTTSRPAPTPSSPLRSADITFELPMKRLEPGEHLLRFEATAGGDTVKREVRFTAR